MTFNAAEIVTAHHLRCKRVRNKSLSTDSLSFHCIVSERLPEMMIELFFYRRGGKMPR